MRPLRQRQRVEAEPTPAKCQGGVQRQQRSCASQFCSGSSGSVVWARSGKVQRKKLLPTAVPRPEKEKAPSSALGVAGRSSALTQPALLVTLLAAIAPLGCCPLLSPLAPGHSPGQCVVAAGGSALQACLPASGLRHCPGPWPPLLCTYEPISCSAVPCPAPLSQKVRDCLAPLLARAPLCPVPQSAGSYD